jgi:ribonuclease P protein component
MESFQSRQRLRKRIDFDRVFRRGVRLDGRLFMLVAAANGLTQDRLGLAVNRRVGGAVVRNRLRRLLRESFRRLEPMSRSCADLVIVGKPELAAASLQEIDRELRDRLRRLDETARVGRIRPPSPTRGV